MRDKTRTELLAELDELRASEQKYRVLLDESSDPIFTFERDGTYRYVNREFANGVGRRQDEIIGQRIWNIFPEAEAVKRFAVVKQVFETGQIMTIEVRVSGPEGDRYYLTTVKPTYDENQSINSVICISKEITERYLMEERLARMAQFDALTDLPNRALFTDRLRHAITIAKRERTRLALMFVDLDLFKPINDNYGHHVGDELLKLVARRMEECVRESDTVGRIGGDEFVVLLPAIETVQDAQFVAEKIRHALNQSFELPDCETLNISSSTGIAIYPEHGSDEIQLAKNADDAMYVAKGRGRNTVQLFQTE